MHLDFEELDYQETPLGAISLRRRADPRLGGEIIHEIRLGEEYLMSSRFTAGETQLAKLGLAALEGDELDIVVGGLGLGYTAAAVLEHASVRSLVVIEVMAPVIDWHRRGLVPLGKRIATDPRCSLVHDDFFTWASSEGGADPESPTHAVLLDIDHSPSHWLAPRNRVFYSVQGLRRLAERLHPGGVFGLWSDDPPERDFTCHLEAVFRSSEAHVVTFPNPYTGGESKCTIYLARKAASRV
jgi:spermidine synthase